MSLLILEDTDKPSCVSTLRFESIYLRYLFDDDKNVLYTLTFRKHINTVVASYTHEN